MAPKIEILTKGALLGEGPHWDAKTQNLFYVDIYKQTIHRYHPATNQHAEAKIGINYVSLIVPVENALNKYVISIGRQLVSIKWDGKSDKVTEVIKLCEVDADEDTLDNRINDGKCDPGGRLWAGTMNTKNLFGSQKGGLFTLNPNNLLKKHLSHVGLSNGLAWNVELKKMYYIDTPKLTVDEFDIDLKHGSLADRKSIFTLPKHDIQGFPDGMTIDTDGNLWVAIFGGSKVIKIDPRQPETLLEIVNLPAKQVTSVAFGGCNLDELYVTSAAFSEDGSDLPHPNGALFRISGLGVKGYAGVSVKL